MDLMEQCQAWNENDEYQNIISAIEALPEADRTPELTSELARAYNNIAGPEDREFYEKAIALLKPLEEYLKDDHSWNFRIAYAYYYLDQESPALHYFKKALEARPGDEDTREFMEDCRSRLSLPWFEKSFRERTAESWELFVRGEAKLRSLLDEKERETASGDLIAACQELLAPAFADVNFELGFNGKKYELILTPEGDRAKLFELVYYRRHAPKAVSEHWNILVGRQPSRGFQLGVSDFDRTVCAQDVRAWVEVKGETPGNREVVLTLYCEKLLPLLREKEGAAWWMLSTLTDQVLGEIPAMSYIKEFEVTDSPKEGTGICLEELPAMLESQGLDLNIDPEHYLENGYTAYQMEPEENPEADWRLDVFAGSTRCPELVNEYLRGDSGIMDAFHRDGAVPGFFCYPLDCFSEEAERSKAVLDFRDALEEALLKEAGADSVTFLGGASGIHCGYLDFIAWDLPAVLNAGEKFFRDCPVEWAGFHTFRRDVSTVRMKTTPDEASMEGECSMETEHSMEAERFMETEDSEEPAHAMEGERSIGSEHSMEAKSSVEQEGDAVLDEKTGQKGGTGNDRTGSFAGFVLLSDTSWDKEQLIRDLKAEWNLDARGEVGDGEVGEESADTLVFPVDDMTAAVSLMPAPVPDQEAEGNAANNYMWPEAVETAKAHKAHLLVAVLGQEQPLLERGKLFTKIMACCCRQKNATGVYTSGTVFEPRFYEEFADLMKEGGLPIFNWIWFGLYRYGKGVCCYTYGMEVFGKDEMEVLDADADASEVRDFLSGIVFYVLENDVTLKDGETIGFSEDQKLPITRSEGVSLPGMTLKIGYGEPE